MKKFLLSAFVVVTYVGYALNARFGREYEIEVTHILTTPTPTPNQSENIPPQSSPAPAMMNQNGFGNMGSMMTSGYKDGQFTGSVENAFYGNVQVQAKITGGKITAVRFLQYPSDRRTSVEINSQAMPMLTSEAIQTQNANVDIVSGATQTSDAFRRSLGSALNQAK